MQLSKLNDRNQVAGSFKGSEYISLHNKYSDPIFPNIPGKDEVRRGFQALLNHDAGRESLPGKLYGYGDRGVAEWFYKSIDESGQTTVVGGCDLFEFVGDKISLKNAFRKCST